MRGVLLASLFAVTMAPKARADSSLPPWADAADLPVPTWARSVAPKKKDEPLFVGPARTEGHRGSVFEGVRLPLYGAARGAGCGGRWLLVGPLAWICSDEADLSGDEPEARPPRAADDGLPYRYFFVGPEGASGFSDLARAEDDAPDADLEPGFAIATTEERTVSGETWQKSRSGYWISARSIDAARPSTFRGEVLRGHESLEVGWVTADRASEYSQGKTTGTRARFDLVRWHEERPSPSGLMVRVSDDGSPPRWMRAKDLARPLLSAPPAEAGGPQTKERWIDVDNASQTLVAYEGDRPVFATLVSTGRGAPGTDTATPPGAHRIWVKLLSTNMDNLDVEDAEHHYSIEDVPYVQFFDKAVALHGAFWHRDFGRPHSHGCVNLAPRDAAWLFRFTGPHLLPGWSASMPMLFEKGTVVRVR